MSRPALLLRLAVPAALIAAGLVTVTGATGNTAVSAEPRLVPSKFRPGAPAGPAYDAKSVLVQFKPKATTSARKAALAKVKGTPDVSVNSEVVTVTGDVPAPELLKKVKADPTVALASLNYTRHAYATPNDWLYANYQKYLPTVRVDKAWDLSKSAGSQVIGVLDTGVDAGHPDLVGHLLPGYNTFNTALPPNDGEGHGTAVTGIIAAGTGNSTGVAGVAWNAKVRPVKVLDDTGSGDDSNLINGLNWAVKNGVRVINMSLGGEGDDPILHQAIQNAYAKGVVLVAAAGNTGAEAGTHFPGAYPEVLSVGATNQSGVLTSFSSYGDTVDLAAPGYGITSTSPRAGTPAGYEPYFLGLAGTSFSSPIVAGVAALVRNKWPSFTPAQVMTRLKATARDAGPRGTDPYYGAGILDAYYALGGTRTTDFAMGPADTNDQPSRATELAPGVAISSTISVEGDVDWYKFTSDSVHQVRIDVTGPMFDSGGFAQNFGPTISLYNERLDPLAFAQTAEPPVDNDGYEIPQALTATTYAQVPVGTAYVAVRNANGSRDSRTYAVKFTNADGSLGPARINGYAVRDVQPGDLSSGAALATKPSITFAQDVTEASVLSGVKLSNATTGATIPAAVTYDAGTRQATIAPTSPLPEATAFRISATGISPMGGGQVDPFSSVFSTVDLVPAKPDFTGGGAYLAANLAWKPAPAPDLDQVIVRRNVGSKVPTLTTGTLVYAGTGSAVKNTGLAQNTTYTYAAWVRDRAGHYSPVAVKQLLGMKSGIATTSTLISYGGSITIKGSTLRIDNKAYAGLPVNVYVRPKTSSKFTLLAALKTTSTGTLSVVTKPAVSSVYMLTFPGNADLMGTRTADITVQVRPTISAVLSPAAITLGKTTAFSGYVAPAHAGRPVYLQQYGNKVWKSIASVKLSTSGKYAFGIRPAVRGKIAYRVWFPADADHATAYTVNKIVTVS